MNKKDSVEYEINNISDELEKNYKIVNNSLWVVTLISIIFGMLVVLLLMAFDAYDIRKGALKLESDNINEMINEQLKTHIREEEDKANKTEISNKPQQLADRYNAICTSLPKVVRLTDKRRRAVRLIRDKGYTPEQLDEYCSKADFVFNLAGVNRPTDPADFKKGNRDFAETLLETLKK